MLPERAVFRVLYAGAHGDPSALDDDLAAARLLDSSDHPPFRFRFIGDGPEKQVLVQQAIDL